MKLQEASEDEQRGRQAMKVKPNESVISLPCQEETAV